MVQTADDDIEVNDERSASRYEIRVEGELAGFSQYRLDGERITFVHTEVDPARAGRGLGGRLIEFAVNDARSRELEIIPECSFVRGWIEKHPEGS